MRKITFTIFSCVLALSSISQKKSKNIYFNLPVIETEEYKIDFQSVYVNSKLAKSKQEVTNKTNEYLVIDLSDIKLLFDFAEVTNTPSMERIIGNQERKIVIKPNSKRKFEITATDNYDYSKVKSFKINFNNIYILNPKGSPIEGEDCQIPLSQNTYNIGLIKCSVTKYEIKNKESFIKMKVENTSDEIIFLYPNRVSMKFPSGNIYANENNRDKLKIIRPNQKKRFELLCTRKKGDVKMKKSVLKIIWNDAFIVPVKTTLGGTSVSFYRN